MLVYGNRLIGTPVLSMQDAAPIGQISGVIIDPDSLKVAAFYLSGPAILRNTNLLDTTSIREYSSLGMVIDSTDELVSPNDIVKLQHIIELNFSLTGLKVETKKGSNLGKVSDFTINSDDFTVRQIVVRRPLIKSFIDPELIISRQEILEVTDYKVIVKDEEKALKSRAEKEDFIPNFVNPFREARKAQAQSDLTNSRTKS